ncbi:MAG TPA: hypothetical protein PKN62_02080 [bacterium]|nr:hypothetical protein [bacterium]
MADNKNLFLVFCFLSIMVFFMGLNFYFNFDFTNIDKDPGALAGMILFIGLTLIYRSLSVDQRIPAFKFFLEAISAAFFVIIVDYLTGYVIGLYPIVCYLTIVVFLVGLLLLIGAKVNHISYMFAGAVFLSIILMPVVEYYIFDKINFYYRAWLIFPAYWLIVVLVKQKISLRQQLLKLKKN